MYTSKIDLSTTITNIQIVYHSISLKLDFPWLQLSLYIIYIDLPKSPNITFLFLKKHKNNILIIQKWILLCEKMQIKWKYTSFTNKRQNKTKNAISFFSNIYHIYNKYSELIFWNVSIWLMMFISFLS